MVKYQSILDFIMIVDHGSYNNASKKLKMSRSSLKKLIKEVENSLDHQLIIDGQDDIVLSAFGQFLYKKFKRYSNLIIPEVKNCIEDINKIKGDIKIAIPYAFSFLTDKMVLQIHEKYPLVNVEIVYFNGMLNLIQKCLEYDIVISLQLPLISAFYINSFGNCYSKLFFHKNNPLNANINLMELSKFSPLKIITSGLTGLNNDIILHAKADPEDTLTIPHELIKVDYENLYSIISETNIFPESNLFSLISTPSLYSLGYIDAFPNYYINKYDVYLLKNRLKDAQLVYNVEKILKNIFLELSDDL